MTPPPPTHPRLVDVAKRAGVSIRTVSNVVNDFPYISTTTRERVEQAIAELGYRPNLIARNLARGRTGLVALVVPQVAMPYFASLADSMLEATRDEEMVLVISQSRGSHQVELEALEGRFGQRIDGVVLSPTTLTDADIAHRRSTIPLVMLGDRTWGGVVTSVGIDHVSAATEAVRHLIAQGRRRIAIVGPYLNEEAKRFRGWAAALREAGIEPDPTWVIGTDGSTGEDGFAAGERLMQMSPRPDAAFFVTDWLALGAVRAFQRGGLTVPDDVAVVGYDDIPYGRASNPTLTTIRPDRAEIAHQAVASLVAQRDGDSAPVAIQASWSLVVRESSGAPATIEA